MILEYSTALPFRWHGNKYCCFYCPLEFIDSSQLKEHARAEHETPKVFTALKNARGPKIKVDISNLNCRICSKSMNGFDEFHEHCRVIHNLKLEKTDILDPFVLSDDAILCPVCGEAFRFFGQLNIHKNKYHGMRSYLCEECGLGFYNRAYLQYHTTQHKNKLCVCKVCNQMFSNRASLRSHFERTHRKFQCGYCEDAFKSSYLRKRHLAETHDIKSAQFKCDQCHLIFFVKSRLVYHIAKVHCKEKNYKCEICGFEVFDKFRLKRHQVSHSNERPFECSFCKKSFQRKKTLKVHLKIHTGDKKHLCKDCGKAFVQVSSLRSHIKNYHS